MARVMESERSIIESMVERITPTVSQRLNREVVASMT